MNAHQLLERRVIELERLLREYRAEYELHRHYPHGAAPYKAKEKKLPESGTKAAA